MTADPDAATAAPCEHEYTLNVQLTHAWCQKCDLVIPVVAGGIRDTIFAQGRASERQRIRDGVTKHIDECEGCVDLGWLADLLEADPS